jgi:hypothetical protein
MPLGSAKQGGSDRGQVLAPEQAEDPGALGGLDPVGLDRVLDAVQRLTDLTRDRAKRE